MHDIGDILQKVAIQNNTTVEEVREEILTAIRIAKSNENPDIQKKWEEIQKEAGAITPETVIAYLASKVLMERE